MAKLIIRDEKGGAERVHEITDDVTTFGRSSANIIQVKDDKASRQHCRIEKAGDGYRLVDLGSLNGTEVNGVKVSGQTLKPGDTITIGQFRVVFDMPVQVSGDELGATVAVTPLAEGGSPAAAAPAAPAAPAAGASEKKPAENAAPRFILEIVEGPAKGRTVELGLEPVTIGRGAGNKLVLEDEAASNYHAEVTKEAIGYVISDLGSTNGTKVNGEKIVKSPLAHGARVRIGATEIAFKNLGAPTEEDAVYGTVVLDSEKLDQELSAARKSGGAVAFLKFLVAAAAVGLVGWLSYAAVKKFQNGTTPAVKFNTDVNNPFFSEGIDSNGNPRGWIIVPGDERNAIMVDKSKGREKPPPGKPESEAEKYSLKFQRDGATAPNLRMECRQSGAFAVDQGKAYHASVFVNSPGAQGLYGLRLTWIQAEEGGGRRHDEFATISGAHPDWDKVEIDARPPSWAGKLELALVACGNSGHVWFDDVELQATDPAKVSPAERSVDFGGVKASLDRCGRLSIERGGVAALAGQIVAEGQGRVETRQELARPAPGYPREAGEETVFKGSMFDFKSRARFNYEQTAGKGAEGVRVRYAFGTEGSELTLDSLELGFTVEPAFAGKAEAYTAEGRKPLAGGEVPGVSELVLHAPAGGSVLAVSFNPPVAVRLEPKGERKRLTVLLAREPSLGAAPREFALNFGRVSAGEAREIEAAFAEVARLFDARDWKAFPDAARRVRRQYPGAAQLARLAELETQYTTKIQAAARQADEAVKLAQNAGESLEAWQLAYEKAGKALAEVKGEWAGTAGLDGKPEMNSLLANLEVELKKTEQVRKDAALEKEAQDKLERARPWINQGEWDVAIAFLKPIIDKYPTTKAAQAARLLLKDCEEKKAHKDYVLNEEDRLLKAIRNDELNNLWDRVIETVEADTAWRKYGKEMKEAAKHLEEAKRKKAGGA